MKILIAIDGSRASLGTLRFAAQFVQRAGEPPTILCVIGRSSDQRSKQVENTFNTARDILAVPEIKTMLRTGQPVQEIVRETESNQFDLLIIGEIRSHFLSQIFKGPPAARIAARTPCPVLIAKRDRRLIRRILLCDSGSGRSEALNRFTARLGKMLEGEEDITVLHVMSQISAGPGVKGGQLRASADELIQGHTPEGVLLERDLKALDQPGVHPTPKVRHGLVVDEIIKEACSGDYDLVIIGAHQGEKWRQFLLDNLAEKILKRVNLPVLVVK
jgi:nucleotide-binding universal stress UspA family protein